MPPVMATQHLHTLAAVKAPFLDWDIYWVDSDNLNSKMMASRQHLQLDFCHLEVKKSDWGTLVSRINVENG
jgi:hypothetical protein